MFNSIVSSDKPVVSELSSSSRKSMSIELFGNRLTVVSDADEEHVKSVVAFLNERLDSIRNGAKRVHDNQVALLVALNLAEELFNERARTSKLRAAVKEKSLKLLASLDVVAQELDLIDESNRKA